MVKNQLYLLVALIWVIISAPAALAQSEEYLPLDYVIHISVDGLRADLLAERLENDPEGLYRNFERLRREGASTFNARTDDAHTNTLPNHTSMISGRPVRAVPTFPVTAHHGYTDNDRPQASWTVHNQGNPDLDYVTSTFDVAHDHGLRTALFSGKSKFVLYEQSYNESSGAPDLIGEDNGRDKIDQFVTNEDGQALVGQYVREMAADPYHYSLVHFRNPDSAGHDARWGSQEWDRAVQDVDGYLGQILDLVENDERLKGRTAVILTADHGGTNSYHWNNLDAANYTIPVFLWSPGNIPAGVDIYDLYSRSIADPGQGRVTYPQKPQPIRNGSTGNMALHLLGLPPIPGSMIDAPYFITHCNIEAGASYDFGETLVGIDVLEAGTVRCLGVAYTDSAESAEWSIIPAGEGYELFLTLPDEEQVLLSADTCPAVEGQVQTCWENKDQDKAVVLLEMPAGKIVRQPPLPQYLLASLGILAVLALVVMGALLYLRRR